MTHPDFVAGRVHTRWIDGNIAVLAAGGGDQRQCFAEAAQPAVSAVTGFAGGGIDDVIDPADMRDRIAGSLKRLPPVPTRTGTKHSYIGPR